MTTSPEANIPAGASISSGAETVSPERAEFLQQLNSNVLAIIEEQGQAGLTDEEIVASGVILAAYQRTVEQKRDAA